MDDNIDSSPEQQGYQTNRFVIITRLELPDIVSSVSVRESELNTWHTK